MLESLQSAKSKYFVFTNDLIFPLFVIFALIIGLVVAFKTNVFQAQSIICELDYQPCGDNSLSAEVARLQGVNLLTFDGRELRAKLTSGDFTIREIDFRKKFPHTLVVSMQSVFPVASIRVKDTNDWLVVDSKRRIIGLKHSDPNVPTLLATSLPAVRVGTHIDDDNLLKGIDASLTIVNELPAAESVFLNSDNLEIQLGNGRTAILTITKDLLPQIRTLQAVLSDSTMIKEAKTIDVRFSQPVLR